MKATFPGRIKRGCVPCWVCGCVMVGCVVVSVVVLVVGSSVVVEVEVEEEVDVLRDDVGFGHDAQSSAEDEECCDGEDELGGGSSPRPGLRHT